MIEGRKRTAWRQRLTPRDWQQMPGQERAEDQEAAPGHEIRTGKPQVEPSTPSHVPGIRQGNARGGYKIQPGHHEDGTSTARRSTGINPSDRDPIDPSSPNLSPP